MTEASMTRQLAERLARDYDASVWRAAFAKDPSWLEGPFTVVCVDLAGCALGPADAQAVAAQFRGRCEPCERQRYLLVFTQEDAAVEAALELQRRTRAHAARICLAGGWSHEAVLDVDGRRLPVLVGPIVDEALLGVARTVPGTISVLPDSYDMFEAALDTCAGNAVLASEWNDGSLSWATLSAPDAASTFAGLGSW